MRGDERTSDERTSDERTSDERASDERTNAGPQAKTAARPDRSSTQPIKRRRAWGVIAAVAALLLIAVVPVVWPARSRGRAELLARTVVWRKAILGAVWRTADPPKNRPWSPQLAFVPEEVAVVSTSDDRNTTVYRYARPLRNNRGQVYLFVVKTASVGLPSAPPTVPDFDSGGIRVGLWSENGMVYALVVHRDADAYQRMVGRPSRSA